MKTVTTADIQNKIKELSKQRDKTIIGEDNFLKLNEQMYFLSVCLLTFRELEMLD